MDLYHAREHLHDLAAGLTGALGDTHPDWLAARLADLDAGNIETLVTQTERLLPQLPDDTAILTLRCHQASDRFDHIWTQPHNQTTAHATA